VTPDQIAALTAIAAITSKVGTWPIGSIIAAVVFGPWIVMGLISRSIEKRHEAALAMYNENIKLVQNYEKMADEQADTIRLNTAASTELTSYLKNRPQCHERIREKMKP
jgi:hypothetical protein